MRILVCGSRDFSDVDHLTTVLNAVHAKHGITAIIEGCANGADRLAEQWAEAADSGIAIHHYPADWKTFGRSAGFKRNSDMADAKPDVVIAFFRDNNHPSRGTAMMLRLAREKGIRTWVPPMPAYQF